MAANDIQSRWDASAALTVTNLASLADTNMWQSGALDDASPSLLWVDFFYTIVFNAAPVAGDSLRFYTSYGDENASEIWEGGIGTSEGTITTAAAKAAVQAGCPLVYEHAWQTSHGTSFSGRFRIYNPAPSMQILVEANGEALAASGHSIHSRYGSPQSQ